ncbi:hypothetical protein [Pseudoxanthomonas sp. UTMC 1351]|uniref:hypothetical protein n=1 Tax=Pseudoxanthomonas sp. UTMC 1351 TaxID=2695853 RepID=UPI0034CFFD41
MGHGPGGGQGNDGGHRYRAEARYKQPAANEIDGGSGRHGVAGTFVEEKLAHWDQLPEWRRRKAGSPSAMASQQRYAAVGMQGDPVTKQLASETMFVLDVWMM